VIHVTVVVRFRWSASVDAYCLRARQGLSAWMMTIRQQPFGSATEMSATGAKPPAHTPAPEAMSFHLPRRVIYTN